MPLVTDWDFQRFTTPALLKCLFRENLSKLLDTGL